MPGLVFQLLLNRRHNLQQPVLWSQQHGRGGGVGATLTVAGGTMVDAYGVEMKGTHLTGEGTET
jgi:molybdenum-dependent DNA-binding transcriptional regulator ModE